MKSMKENQDEKGFPVFLPFSKQLAELPLAQSRKDRKECQVKI